MNTKTLEFIEKAKNKHGDRYDYSKVIYINNKTKIVIICKTHGIFYQSPDDHLHCNGCIKCAHVKAHLKNKSNKEEFIIKAIKVHGNKYDYTNVNYHNARTNVDIICKTHGVFPQMPYNHLGGQGCPKCGLETISLKQHKLTFDKFLEKANNIHNNKYDYSKIAYKNTNDIIVIICDIHGEFSQRISYHLSGSGCHKCGTINSGNSQRKDINTFIEEATKNHGDKYDYSKSIYINCKTLLEIICKIHGSFWQSPLNHLRYGCAQCSNERMSLVKTYTLEQFIENAIVIHGDKYDYSESKYINSKSKITIKCKIHGFFDQIANKHIQGHNCPNCNKCPNCLLWATKGKLCSYCKPKNQNKLYFKTKEYKIINFLKNNLKGIDFIHNKSVGSECTNGHLFPDVRFDCNHFNLILEIDEFQHRGANYQCDKQRMYDIIAKLGLPCVFIRYNPDNKNSDKNILLAVIKKYLNLKENEQVWDDFGFKVDYLFYKY